MTTPIVPGLLDSATLQQRVQDRLKASTAAATDFRLSGPHADAAYQFVDRLRNEYLTAPVRTAVRGGASLLPGPVGQLGSAAASFIPPTDREQRRIDGDRRIANRVEQAGEVLDPRGGFLSTLGRTALLGPAAALVNTPGVGQLDPEEQQRKAEEDAAEAREREAAVKATVETRRKLRGMTDEQAAALGLPVAPGGVDAEFQRQAAARDQQMAAQAVGERKDAEAAVLDKDKQATQTWWLNAINAGVKGVTTLPTAVLRGGAAAQELTAAFLTGTEAERSRYREWLDTTDAVIEKLLPTDKARSKELLTQLAQGTGSMVGFMLSGYVGAAVGVPFKVGSLITGGLSMGSAQYVDAEQFNAANTQKLLALVAGTGLGALEAISLDRILFRANNATGGLVQRMLSGTAADFGEEFLQELSQSVGADVVAKWVYDETRDMDAKKWLTAAAIGGVIGGMTGVATRALNEAGVDMATGPETPEAAAEPAADTASADEQQAVADMEELQKQLDEALAPEEANAEAEDAQAMVVPALKQEDEAAFRTATQAADAALPPDAAKAVDEFVGHPAGEPREGAVGFMRGAELERIARGANPSAAASLEEAFAPIRERLRKQVGDTIRLYRVQQPVTTPASRLAGFDSDERAALSWTTDPKLARQLADATRSSAIIPESRIVELEQEMERTGRATISPSRWLERMSVDTMEFDPQGEMIAIMGPDGMVTDTDSVREYVEGINEWRREDNAAQSERAQKIVVRDIPLDEVMWVTDRAGQSEFIVRNRQGLTAFIPPTGVPDATELFHGRGGTIPVNAAGKLELTHEATAAREVLDPMFRGSRGTGAGAESYRLGTPPLMRKPGQAVDPDVVERVYYGVGDLDFVPQGRPRLDTDPYQSEGIGHIRHTVSVDPDTMYNFREDPLNIWGKVTRATPSERLTEFERIVRDNGFAGIYYQSSQRGQVAMLFDKRVPERVIDKNYGLPPDEIAKPEDFVNPTAETFSEKGGWFIVTATREAVGDDQAPENVKANQTLRNVLKRSGRKFVEVSGAYKGVPQGTSFMVFAPESLGRQLGSRFRQESILTRRGLEYTDGSGRLVPAVPSETAVGDAARQQDFFSTLPSGEAFSIGLDFGDDIQAMVADAPLEPGALEPLPGLPASSPGPIESVVRAARAYAQSIGLPVRRQATYVQANFVRGRRIAEAYEAMKHDPSDPAVAAAYQAMIDETLAQYQFVKATGLVVEAIEPGQADPYPEGPKQVLEDLQRGHLWFFPTDQGFGTQTEITDNPLLAPTDERIGDRVLLANDVFRIVHDFFGHGIEGAGFGARGEENAWQSHMRLYTAAALPAVTSETRGQNSWVNFGPFGEQNRANQRETVYADQKTGIMPSWTWTEGVADDVRPTDVNIAESKEFRDWFGDSKIVDEAGNPVVMYHGTGSAPFRVFEDRGERGFVGFFIDNKRDALSFASEANGNTPRVEAVYLRAENPWDYQNPAHVKALVDAAGASTTQERLLRTGDFMSVEGYARRIRELGFDAAWMAEGVGRMRHIGVFEPTQIKSVSNIGTFSSEDPDILAAVAKPDRVKQLTQEIPGLRGVAKYMAPDEQAKLMRSNASKIVSIFEDLPAPEEMAAVAISGRAKRGWYQRSAQALLDIFGLDDAPRFAALLAALSPQVSVESNAINALRMWTNWNNAGRPQDRKTILRIMGQSVQGTKAEKSVLDAWRNNTVTALTDAEPENTVLSGPKVDSFMRNLRGEVNAVTNDAWMANYANVDQTLFKKSGEKGAGKGPGYVAMSAAVRRAADVASRLTGETWTPSEIQETVWSWAKTLYEKANTVVTAEDVLKSGQLTAEEIGATPDFASLFTSGVYRNILEKGGFDVESLARSSGRADAVDRDTGSPLSAEGTGLAQGAFERHLRRAARRLDALRARRLAAEAEKAAGNTAPAPDTFDIEDTFFPEDRGGVEPGIAALTADDEAFLDEQGLLPATSTGRGPYAQEQQRPRGGIAGGTQADAGDVSLQNIASNLRRIMALTARQGRLTLKGANVMGQFSRRTGVIRVRDWTDVSTLVHEAGHAMDAAAGPELRTLLDNNKAAFRRIAQDLYAGDTSNMEDSRLLAEGFAEFFRVYVLHRAYVDANWTQLGRDVDQLLERVSPALKTGLDATRAQYERYLQLPSAQLVRNLIVPAKVETGARARMREIKEQGISTWMHEVSRTATRDFVNRYAGVNELVARLLNLGQQNAAKAIDLKAAEDPGKLIRLAANSGNRAMVQTNDGVMPYRGTNSTTRGLRDALLLSQGLTLDDNIGTIDEVRAQDFAAYLVALRGLDEYRRLSEGKLKRPPLKATIGDLRKAVKEYAGKYPEFVEAARIVNEYGMALWTKTYDAGLMTKETYEAGLDRRFYAPLLRDLSDKKGDVKGKSVLTARAPSSFVKRFQGSDRGILDPMTVLMQKTFALEQTIAMNEPKKALAALAERVGKAGALVERVPATKVLGQQFSVEQVARRIMQDDMISETDAADLMVLLNPLVEEGKFVTMFRSETAPTLGENIMFFWENGKLAAVQLNADDLGTDVLNTMNAVGRENLPLLVDLLAKSSSLFRASITSWPDFLMVNFIRDQFSAFLLTDVGFKPFVTGLRGAFDELRQSEWSKQYNAAMGIMGGMNVAALHQARINRDLAALRKKGYLARAFSGGPIGGMARVVELTETGTRLGLFRKAYERGKADGLTDWEASVEASYIATDYIDFGLNGARMTVWRRLVPFLNAQLQGLYKMMRTLGGDEVRQRKGLRFVLRAYFKDLHGLDLSRRERQQLQTGRRAWAKMASLALVSAALHFLFRDDEDYQEASEYLRTTGWVIPVGGGRIVYVPKPFELAVLANFTERALEYGSGDPEAVNRFVRGVGLTMLPPVSPPLVQLVIERVANKDFFTGREIVPSNLQTLAVKSPEMVYDNYTSELAKQIAGLGIPFLKTPLHVEHLLSGLGASAYRDITTLYNQFSEHRPAMDATDAPISRRFVRDIRRGSASAQDFWRYASTVTGQMEGAKAGYQRLLDSGRLDEAAEFLNDLDPDERAYAVLNEHFAAEYKRLNPIYRARQMTSVISAMRREMSSELGLDDTTIAKVPGTIALTAKEKAEVDELLSELARREMRNTLVYMRLPGWSGKKPLDTQTTIGMLEAVSPETADELRRRVKKAKVYDADTVNEYWPDVRDRLSTDREQAFLKDILAIAKATSHGF